MANEFHFCVSLSIVHPTADPQQISKEFFGLRPRIQVAAGSERIGKRGLPIVPHRRASLTHSLADLHEEERLFSGDVSISEFLRNRLSELEKYRSTFLQLKKEGRVELLIGWFSDSNHSAEVFSAETLKRCGDLGIDLELNYYSPSLVCPNEVNEA